MPGTLNPHAAPPNNFTSGAQWTTAALGEQRGNTSFAFFANEWWMTGGTLGNGPSTKIYNEIWHSADGIFWQRSAEAVPAACQKAWRLIAFGGKLFMLADGPVINGTAVPNFWVSGDGQHWSKPAIGPTVVFGGAILNNRLYVFTVTPNFSTGKSTIFMYSTGDGTTWTPRSTSISAVNVTPTRLRGYLGKLWLEALIGAAPATYSIDNGSTWNGGPLPDVFTSATLVTEHRVWAIRSSVGELLTSNNLNTYTLLATGNFFKDKTPPLALPTAALTLTSSSAGLWLTRQGANTFQAAQTTHALYRSTDAGAHWTLRQTWTGNVGVSYPAVTTLLSKAFTYAPGHQVYATNANLSWDQVSSGAVVRNTPSLTTFINQLWLVGDLNTPKIHSSLDGNGWTQRATGTNMGVRSGQALAVFGSPLWALGGGPVLGGAAQYRNVYKTFDGITWTTVTTAPAWPGRFQANAVVFQNKLWLQGGGKPQTPEYLRDLWSSTDGINWTSHTVPVELTTATLTRMTTAAGKLVLAGSEFNASTPLANPRGWVWSSTDGDHWTKLSTNPGWEGHRLQGFATLGQHTILYADPVMAPWYTDFTKNETGPEWPAYR